MKNWHDAPNRRTILGVMWTLVSDDFAAEYCSELRKPEWHFIVITNEKRNIKKQLIEKISSI
jgi:hypothetical protein